MLNLKSIARQSSKNSCKESDFLKQSERVFLLFSEPNAFETSRDPDYAELPEDPFVTHQASVPATWFIICFLASVVPGRLQKSPTNVWRRASKFLLVPVPAGVQSYEHFHFTPCFFRQRLSISGFSVETLRREEKSCQRRLRKVIYSLINPKYLQCSYSAPRFGNTSARSF